MFFLATYEGDVQVRAPPVKEGERQPLEQKFQVLVMWTAQTGLWSLEEQQSLLATDCPLQPRKIKQTGSMKLKFIECISISCCNHIAVTMNSDPEIAYISAYQSCPEPSIFIYFILRSFLLFAGLLFISFPMGAFLHVCLCTIYI